MQFMRALYVRDPTEELWKKAPAHSSIHYLPSFLSMKKKLSAQNEAKVSQCIFIPPCAQESGEMIYCAA